MLSAEQASITAAEAGPDVAPEGMPAYGLTDAQRAQRRHTLGASEIAAIIGHDPYRSPLDLWAEKTGRGSIDEPSEYSEWGLRLERVIAEKYAEVRGATMLTELGTLVSPREPWMSATPDRIALFRTGERVDVQLKNKSEWLKREWGESGTDDIPVAIAAQVHWELLVLRDVGHEITRADVAALFGGNTFRCFTLHFDPQIADDMRAVGWEFWHDFVLADKMPPADGSERTAKHLARLFQKHSENIRPASWDEDRWISELRVARDEKKIAEARETLLENQLKQAIAEHAGLTGPSGKILWKSPKPSVVTDWQSAFNALRNDLAIAFAREPGDSQVIGALVDRALTQFTKERENSRRFTVNFPRLGITR